VDPAFDEPSDYQEQMASEWANEHFTYRDTPTRYESTVDETEHGGDGVTVKGSFLDDGGQNVGQWEFAILRDENGDRAMVVDTISIDHPYRGGGVAKRWVQHLEAVGRREGVVRISMWDQSSGFWESQGYTASFQGAFKTSEKML
jgi:GNAT superfamily N-acetyltransferase